ncbi:MAG: RcpC/CpaB family pilus assembly protein [Planctomycetaceae bacterium]
MRLNTFPVTDSQAHSGMLKPGDRVDVKVTFTGQKGALQMNTLVENVEVFACEEKIVKGSVVKAVIKLDSPVPRS